MEHVDTSRIPSVWQLAECTGCGQRARMFPHALVSLLARKERGESCAWLACRNGHLFTADARTASDALIATDS